MSKPNIDLNKKEKISELLSTYFEYGEFNGAIAVVDHGEVVFKSGYGYANMEWKVPNQADTKFRLASITKQFTAMLIMQLVAEGKLSLEEPIATYLPDYPKENGSKVTIHHLLTHSSGIPNSYEPASEKPIRPDSYTSENLVAEFSGLPLEFAPGEKFSYCNAGYVLLGHIAEKIEEKPYEILLRDRIFGPLKMKDTGFDKHRDLIENRASGYFKNWGDYYNANYMDPSKPYAAGGLYSTVEDMALWDSALYSDKLLAERYRKIIFAEQIPDPGYNGHYGYGWSIKKKRIGDSQVEVETVGHDGVIDGFCALYIRIPETASAIIVLSNIRRSPLNAITKGVMGILFDEDYSFPRKSVAYSLLEKINEDGIGAGVEYFQKVKRDDGHYLSEDEINIISYKLLQKNLGREAAAVLELGIVEFPKAFNLYDSYGEILRGLGREEDAIVNYKKSLKLNPENENGIKMLKEMGVEVDKESLYLMKSYPSWGKELFTFPLSFAPELNLQGAEEAHFTPGWRNVDSPEFWSYSFVWNIEGRVDFSREDLEGKVQIYFDGLMKGVNKNKDLVPPLTVASLQGQASDPSRKFSGTVDIFDAFVTNKVLRLNTSVENIYCARTDRTFTVFRFSPRPLGEEVWDALNAITLNEGVCEI